MLSRGMHEKNFIIKGLGLLPCVHVQKNRSGGHLMIYELRREKTGFLHMLKQRCRSAKLISDFVFAT